MKIVLVQRLAWEGAFGGAHKANRRLLELLAEAGHHCLVIVPEQSIHSRVDGVAGSMGVATAGVTRILPDGSAVTVCASGAVQVHTVTEGHGRRRAGHPTLIAYFQEQVETFEPDVILVSADDPGQVLLKGALRVPGQKIVLLARATLTLGVGPMTAFPNPGARRNFEGCAGIVVNSAYLRDYLRTWAGVESFVTDIPTYSASSVPPPDVATRSVVTMINPCAMKGISLFLEMADRCPATQFAVVPTWGTTSRDIADLERRPNISVWAARDQIDSVYRQSAVLLVPSVCDEAFGRVVIEAMLEGVPVIASDVGGLREAKLGIPELLPVNMIRRYLPRLDERMVPVADVPVQNATPWVEALARLMSDGAIRGELAQKSRRAAVDYVSSLSLEPVLGYLEWIRRTPTSTFA